MRFRKKPAFFDAEQFTVDHVIGVKPLPAGVTKHSEGDAGSLVGALIRFSVTTAHGQPVYLQPGDWIVKEPNGNGYYPIKDEIMPTIADPAD